MPPPTSAEPGPVSKGAPAILVHADLARVAPSRAVSCQAFANGSGELQRRGISCAESKTECQPTNHCKLYSSKIPDRARDRKAHGPCPQAQPLRTSRFDHDPGRLSPWTACFGGLRSPMASGRARPRPHGMSAGPRTARHPSILSGATRFVPYASSAARARPRLTSSSRSAADR
jgi:hypothetical protein